MLLETLFHDIGAHIYIAQTIHVLQSLLQFNIKSYQIFSKKIIFAELPNRH